MLLNRLGAGFCRFDPKQETLSFACRRVSNPSPARPAAFYGWLPGRKNDKRLSTCTADELHYVCFRLRLEARSLALPAFSRGAGLSTYGSNSEESFNYLGASFESGTPFMKIRGSESKNVTKYEELRPTANLMDVFTRLSNKVSSFFNGRFCRNLESHYFLQDNVERISSDLRGMSGNSAIEGDQPLFPAHVLELQERFIVLMDEFLKQFVLAAKNDWDFDYYLEEDVPAAMEYIRTQCLPKDGKLLAISNSVGGILLYAMLSRCRKFC